MTNIACNMIISMATSQLLLTIPICIYRTLFSRIRPDRIDIQVDVKKIS